MKRAVLTLLFHICTIAGTYAQKGLDINRVFDGYIVPKEEMVETVVRGSQAKAYNLSLFKSIKFKADPETRDKVEKAVKSAITDAVELEQEKREGHIYYAVMQIPPAAEGLPKRFVCYQCAHKNGSTHAITLVYMEGHATLQQLRKTFKKK